MNADQIYQAYCDQLVEIQELTEKLKKWEELADRLIVYAKDYVRPIDPFANHRDYKLSLNVIEQYEKLKEFTDGSR